MAVKTDIELAAAATIIQNETADGANTADRVGQLLNDIIENKVNKLDAPKIYKAFIAQAGTAAPTMTVIKNDLSAAIIWTRSSAGVYVGTLAGAFLAAKTFFPNMNQSLPIVDRSIFIFRIDDNSISIQSRAISTTAFSDLGQTDLFGIEINVYN